jgi:hypothetical protein
MTRIATIAVALFALASPALAGVPQHPGQGHHAVLSARVCGTPVVLSAAGRLGRDATIDAFVNGHHLAGTVARGGVYLVGSFTVVQAPRSGNRIVARAVRTIPACARLRVVFDWK